MVQVRRLRGEMGGGRVKKVALLNTSLPKQHTYSRLGRAAHPFLRGRRGSGHADRPRGARGSVQGTLHLEFLETAVARTESGQNLPRRLKWRSLERDPIFHPIHDPNLYPFFDHTFSPAPRGPTYIPSRGTRGELPSMHRLHMGNVDVNSLITHFALEELRSPSL